MKTYIRLKQHKHSTPKHKTIRTTKEVSPWNEQLYKITGGLNRFYRRLTSLSSSAVALSIQKILTINKKSHAKK